MKTEYIIVDNTVILLNAKNPLEERYFFNDNKWVKGFKNAEKFAVSQSAIDIARKLNIELPVKVLMLQIENNRIGVGEVNFQHNIS